MILKFRSVVSLVTCSFLFSSASTVPSVGIILTPGEIVVDGSSVRGNSMLFEGAVISSGDTTSNLKFVDGANLLLRPGSTMKVYREHGVLVSGIAVQHEANKHAVIADGLRVSSPTKNGVVAISVKDKSHFEVSAETGEAEIRTAAGNLVARVESGSARSFAVGGEGQDANAVQLQGILRQDSAGKYLLTDPQTNVTYSLSGGTGMQQLVGSSVMVKGTVVAGGLDAGGLQLVQVGEISQLGASAAVAGAALGGAAPAGIGALLTTGTIIFAVVVAAVGVLIGFAAGGGFSGGSSPASPVTP